MTKISDKWTTRTIRYLDGSVRAYPVLSVGFGLFDAKGREVGCAATIERWDCAGGYVYLLSTLRDGKVFGASMGVRGARRENGHATIEAAQLEAEAAIERTRKAAAKRYGATPAEVEAKAAEQAQKRAEAHARKVERNHASYAVDKARAAAERAELEAANVEPVAAPAVEVAPAPAAQPTALDEAHAFVEAEACRVLNRPRHVEPAPAPATELPARFRLSRDLDGAVRVARIAPRAAPVPVGVSWTTSVEARTYWGFETAARGSVPVGSFGLVDVRGRAVDCIIDVGRDAETQGDEPAPAIRVILRATRDGEPHGPTTSEHLETFAAVEAAIEAAPRLIEGFRQQLAARHGATVEEAKAKLAGRRAADLASR